MLLKETWKILVASFENSLTYLLTKVTMAAHQSWEKLFTFFRNQFIQTVEIAPPWSLERHFQEIWDKFFQKLWFSSHRVRIALHRILIYLLIEDRDDFTQKFWIVFNRTSVFRIDVWKGFSRNFEMDPHKSYQ